VIREKDGTLDLEKLLPPSGGTAKSAPPPRKLPGKAAQPPEWMVQVKKAALEQFTVKAVDRTPQDPVTVRLSPDVVAENPTENSRGKVRSNHRNKTGKVAAPAQWASTVSRTSASTSAR
jgi:hypothetical protein